MSDEIEKDEKDEKETPDHKAILKGLVKEALSEVIAENKPAPAKTQPKSVSFLDALFGA